MTTKALIEIRNLKKYFPVGKALFGKNSKEFVHAVDGLNFDIIRGETLGLVGESGCGKSTTGRTILQLYPATDGCVNYDGKNLVGMKPEELRKMRKRMQIIFQDPYSSLDPRMSVSSIIAEPLRVHKIGTNKDKVERIQNLLSTCGLSPSFINRYPHEFSGGQRQRIGIARALAVNPEFIVCDEPISALDVSIQAQIVNLLEKLQADLGLTYLFIAHDLSMVRHISTRVAVMYLGKIVELTDRVELYEKAQHPYTKALLSAIPIPDPKIEKLKKAIVLEGDVPNPINPPNGCRFNTRCKFAKQVCFEQEPEFREVAVNHYCACHLV